MESRALFSAVATTPAVAPDLAAIAPAVVAFNHVPKVVAVFTGAFVSGDGSSSGSVTLSITSQTGRLISGTVVFAAGGKQTNLPVHGKVNKHGRISLSGDPSSFYVNFVFNGQLHKNKRKVTGLFSLIDLSGGINSIGSLKITR